jgi:sarcosine oxidase subunit beta
VVGAGIVGAASAYRLAEAGLKVLLLEKEATFAKGSTGRSAAGVRVQFSEPLNVLLSYHSILEYQRIPAGLPSKSPCTRGAAEEGREGP